MGTVAEIASAVEKLSPAELAELSDRIEPRLRALDKKRRALESTSGYLTETDQDFVEAVEQAGKGLPDNHEW
ncbi:MAG: hypothetical protein AAGC74_03790 [Verrucomicrobiota bacterium]